MSAPAGVALEPVGLMRKIGLGETLRIALMGNDEQVGADTAARIGLVSEVVAPDDLWSRAHEIAAIIATAAVGDPGHGQGDLGVLDKPYRAAMEQNLIYTRLGIPRAGPSWPSREHDGIRATLTVR